MQQFLRIKETWAEIPKEIQQFLIRALIIFLVWKLAYHLYLKPERVIDKPLTIITTIHTTKALSAFYTNSQFFYDFVTPNNKQDFFYGKIYKDRKKSLGIADPCNALELYILFTGFLLAMWVNVKRFLIFIVIGIPIVYLCNIIRCFVIGYLNIENSWTVEIAHHFIFKLIMYGLIFIGWVKYLKVKEA